MGNTTRVITRKNPVQTTTCVMLWFEEARDYDELIITLPDKPAPSAAALDKLNEDLEHWAPQLMESGEVISLTELAARIEQQRPPGPVWSVILAARDFARRVMAELNVHEQHRVVHNNDPAVCHSHDYMDPNQHMLDALAAVTGEEWEGAKDTRRGDMMTAAWDIARANGWFMDPIPHRCMECNAPLPDDSVTYCAACVPSDTDT